MRRAAAALVDGLAPLGHAARYAGCRPASIRYLGWLGRRNLGDEVVHEAVAGYVAPRRLAWRPETGPRVVRRLERRHAATLLGGGTLIGGRYLDDLLAEPRPERRVVFGTGVIDPEFPHSYRDGTAVLDRWTEALADATVPGVRGPRSAALLADRGLPVPVIGDPVAAFVQNDEFWQPGSRRIGINVGHSGGRVWGSELAMLRRVADLVRRLKASGWQIQYHVVWPSDLAVTRLVMNDTDTRGAPLHTSWGRADDYLALVRRCDAFVGMKLHAVALAVCAGVPTGAVEYQPKCRDFMASVDLERVTIRSDRLHDGALAALVDELVGDGPVLAKTGLERLRGQRERQQAAARDLVRRLG